MSLPRKKKKCKTCGRDRYIFSYGNCGECAAKEKAYKLKRKTPIQHGKPIKKQSKKRTSVRAADRSFYKSIWDERDHYCEECVEIHGRCFKSFLGTQMEPFMFSHIITKAAHPKLRHVKENINLLCLAHHQQWETGDRSSMHIHDRNLRTIDHLLELERTL